MLYLIGIIISLFLGFILLSKKDKSIPDKILAAWLFFTGIHLLLFYIFITGQYKAFPFLLGFELPLPLVHGPFLFLYVTALTSSHSLRKNFLLHFIPFIVALLSLMPFFFLPSEKKATIYLNEGKEYEVLLSVLYAGILLSGVSYSLFSLIKLHRHQKAIGDQFSYTEQINLSWLRYLILGSAIIWVVVIFGSDPFVFGIVVLYVLFIGYFGIKQLGIFTNVNTNPVETTEGSIPVIIQDDINPRKIKYEKSSLTNVQTESIHQRLIQLMQSEKLYSNPQLNLTELANKLNIHPNTLSQVINTMEKRNFFDYINLHRVEAFKQLASLPTSQKFTLLSLAFDCGFNSKTSFNRNFKKATGLSPTEYLTQQNISLE